MRAEHQAELQDTRARNVELDRLNRELRDGRFASEGRIAELSHKLETRDGQVDNLKEELTQLQQQFQATSR